VADSSRARILFQRLAIAGKPCVLTVDDYRRIARRTRSVLLFYWLSPQSSYVWAVTPELVHGPFPLPPAEQIQGWVDQYRHLKLR